MKEISKTILALAEIAFLPFLVAAALILVLYRKAGSQRLWISTQALKKIGVFPIRDHYYEPLFNDKALTRDLASPRLLPGIEFNIAAQLTLMKMLKHQDEFDSFLEDEKQERGNKNSFTLKNSKFGVGDAEFLFNFLRHTKPKRVIEIGCGESTKIISGALGLNLADDKIKSVHTCIEPYEQPWLERFSDINLIRERVEDVGLRVFEDMEEGDLLFIDSSHVIRPQGDVLHEYLTIVPILRKGVYVHVHDIFTPHDYLTSWVRGDVKFWNEQYLLEALLTKSDSFEIVAALNLLKHSHFEELKSVCRHLTEGTEPGSFYFRSVGPTQRQAE